MHAELKNLGISRDRVERGAQLVAHRGKERALRPIRGLRLIARTFGLGAQTSVLGRDARSPLQLAADRRAGQREQNHQGATRNTV